MLYPVLLCLAGVLQGLMLSFNGRLAAYFSPITVVFFVHSIPTALLLVYLVCFRKARLLQKASVPAYVFLVGAVGLSMVAVSSYTTARIGAVTFACVADLTNMVFAAIFDHFGFFGVERRPFRLRQIPSYLMAIAGVLLVVTGLGNYHAVSFLSFFRSHRPGE